MKLDAKVLCKHIVTEDICSSSSFLKKLLRLYVIGFCNQGAYWSSSCGWTEKLRSQHPSQVGMLVTYLDPCIDWLVMYWEPCIEIRDYHYITSPIRYWYKGSTVDWYKVLRFFLLVTSYFDNSGFSGVVTLNSLVGFCLGGFPHS